MATPILNLPTMTSGQSAKENTFNQAIQFLEAAMNEVQTLDFSSGDVTVTLTDAQRYKLFSCTSVSAPRNLNLPSCKRDLVIDNTSGVNDVTIVRGSDNYVVEAGEIVGVVVNSGTLRVYFDSAAGAGSINFTALGDVPSSYSGHSLKVVRVKADETGLEFVAAGAGISDFVDLSDVPSTYTAFGGYFVKVKEDETGLEFAEGGMEFIELSDAPADYTGSGLMYVRVKEDETGLEFVLAGDLISNFNQLTDTPDFYVGAAGYLVAVNDTENGLEFIDPVSLGAGGDFTDLGDTPENYTDFGGYYLRVKTDESGIEFVASGGGGAFLGLSDTPDSFEGAENMFVRVNGTGDELVFDAVTLGDLDVDYTTPPTAGQVLIYDVDTSKWVPSDPPDGVGINLNTLGDVNVTGAADGQVLTWDEDTGKWIAADVEAGDAFPSFTGNEGKVLAVNGTEDGVEWIDIPAELPALTGNEGKVLKVSVGEGGVEWADESGGASYPDMTGNAGKVLAVDSGEDDVEWIDPPVGVTHVAISFFVGGTPAANEIATRYTVVDDFSVPSGASGSYANLVTGPSGGSIVIDMQKNGSSFGSITFSSGSTTGSISVGTSTAFTAGDKIDFVSPANLRSSEDLSVSILGTV